LFADAPHGFWLDSSSVIEGLSRFSYLGDGTGENAEYMTYSVAEGIVKVQRPGQETEFIQQSFYDYLDEQI
ncbi:hypothetical protein MOF05_22205, partial [Bacillus haynesii]|nr:hypothetical protein [Bacillus haynesii]